MHTFNLPWRGSSVIPSSFTLLLFWIILTFIAWAKRMRRFSKYLLLCSIDKRKAYRFGTTLYMHGYLLNDSTWRKTLFVVIRCNFKTVFIVFNNIILNIKLAENNCKGNKGSHSCATEPNQNIKNLKNSKYSIAVLSQPTNPTWSIRQIYHLRLKQWQLPADLNNNLICKHSVSSVCSALQQWLKGPP